MAYDIGPKIGIDGEAEFRKQLRDINTGIKTLGTEMTVVTTAFMGQEKSEKALTAQNDVLERTVLSLNDKLELQKKMLQQSAAAYGEADERTQQWQQAVNKTEAEINKANAKIRENDEALEQNGDTVEETAEKHEGAMSRIANATKTAMKVAGAALAAGATAIAALAKQSLEGYGNYEQLVGGVETLYSGSFEGVLENAANAYKTAGISANEYMETATSFAASLISSLEGDTVKAAEVADLAITDMADNANKMGSSMESIQNAYQGFAKQNYTMLDNLKLGYGGTKEEMQRLLKDAEKITGKKFDLSNYADVVEAIHAIQTEMGITGTTAREASETIQGSTAAMQSAWGNLLAGLAQPYADLDQLINNLVESVVTMLGNVLPRLETFLSGVGQVVQNLAPVIAQSLPGMIESVLPSLLEAAASLIEGLAGGLVAALPVLVPSAVSIIGQLVSTLMELLPELLTAAVEIINTLAADLVEQIPELIPSAVEMILGLVETLIDNVDKLIDPAIDIVISLADGIINALPKLLEKAPVIIAKLVTAIVENVPKLLAAAAEIIGKLVMGIIENLPALGNAAGQIIASIVQGIMDLIANIWDVGSQIVSGIWEGIKEKAGWLKDQVFGFFGGIVDGVKGFLGIHSPSRVFAGIGENMAAGLGQGWDKEYASIQRDIQNGLDFDSGTVSANMRMSGLTTAFNGPDLAEMMAGMVNGVQTAVTAAGGSYPQSATIILQAGDGMTLARWILPDLRAAMRDDPEVV